MLECSRVSHRLLAIGMLGALGLLLIPDPAWGQSAVKEKPVGHNHRFPPLPDKIQRLDAYRQRRERAGILSKLVYWAAEYGGEHNGTSIIDSPSEGPVKSLPNIASWTRKPGLTITSTVTVTPAAGELNVSEDIVMPDEPEQTPDPEVKQVSATFENELVHELVVPAENDPSLPPLPDQIQPAAPRKPKVPMIRRVPELSSSASSAIKTVDHEEMIPTKDLPSVRGIQQESSSETSAPEPNVDSTEETKESSDTGNANSTPRPLPNLTPEKGELASKKQEKKENSNPAKKPSKQAKKTTRSTTPANRTSVSSSSRHHPSSVRTEIKRTSAHASMMASSKATSTTVKSTRSTVSNETTPRVLPDLDDSKELPPIPTEEEVAENQRQFEEALRKVVKKSSEDANDVVSTELTLPTDPAVEEESAVPAVEFAEAALPSNQRAESAMTTPFPEESTPAAVSETEATMLAMQTTNAVPVNVETQESREEMSEAEAIEHLEASVSTPPVEGETTASRGIPVIPSDRSTRNAPEFIPVPRSFMTTEARQPPMDDRLGEARRELEFLVHGVKSQTSSDPDLNNAREELEALAEGRPIPRTTTSHHSGPTNEELRQAQSELDELSRQKLPSPDHSEKIAPTTLPAQKTELAKPSPKAITHTPPKKPLPPANPAATQVVVNPKAEKTKKASTAEKNPTKSPPNAKVASSKTVTKPKTEPSMVQSVKEKESKPAVAAPSLNIPAAPILPDMTQMKPTLPGPTLVDTMQTQPGPTLADTKQTQSEPTQVDTKPTRPVERSEMKSHDVTKLANDLKKGKKTSPNPSSLSSKEKGSKNSGIASQSAKLAEAPLQSTPSPKPKETRSLVEKTKPSTKVVVKEDAIRRDSQKKESATSPKVSTVSHTIKNKEEPVEVAKVESKALEPETPSTKSTVDSSVLMSSAPIAPPAITVASSIAQPTPTDNAVTGLAPASNQTEVSAPVAEDKPVEKEAASSKANQLPELTTIMPQTPPNIVEPSRPTEAASKDGPSKKEETRTTIPPRLCRAD